MSNYIDSYIKDLLDTKGNLPCFRDVAHRVGGVLSLKYVENYPNSQDIVQDIVLLPVLRAGSAFEKSFLKRVFPPPRICYIATKRDTETLKPKILYKTFGLNEEKGPDTVIILEPMLATGGTMVAVINEINKSFNPKKIVVVSAFVSKQAEELLGRLAHIVALSKGHDLNEKGYILINDPYDKEVSTLDFGDEYCGTYSH